MTGNILISHRKIDGFRLIFSLKIYGSWLPQLSMRQHDHLQRWGHCGRVRCEQFSGVLNRGLRKVTILWMVAKSYKPPKGWLKPKQNNGMFTIYQHQLVDGKHPIIIPLFTVFRGFSNGYQLVFRISSTVCKVYQPTSISWENRLAINGSLNSLVTIWYIYIWYIYIYDIYIYMIYIYDIYIYIWYIYDILSYIYMIYIYMIYYHIYMIYIYIWYIYNIYIYDIYIYMIYDIYMIYISYIYIHPLVMTNIAMERSTNAINIGKPSISIRAMYTMAMLNNQRVYMVWVWSNTKHPLHYIEKKNIRCLNHPLRNHARWDPFLDKPNCKHRWNAKSVALMLPIPH